MAIRITGDAMVLETGNRVVAAARFGARRGRRQRRMDRLGLSCSLFNRDQAMTALMVVELPEGRHHQEPVHADHGVRA
jgi:hypothetical protein